MKRLYVICFLLAPLFLVAQNFSAQLSSGTVKSGERFKLSYSIDAEGTNFRPPDLSAFTLLSGPNRSSNMQWVNGEYSSSLTYTYILVAQNTGKFEIGPGVIEVGKKEVRSNTLSVKVIKGSRAKAQNKSKPAQNKGHQHQTSAGNDDVNSSLFMKLFVDKKQAFVGEQIIATYVIYMNTTIVNYAHNRPVFNGFYAQDVELDPSASLRQETINGKPYTVATMKKVVLTPQKSGKLELPSLEMELVVRVEDRRRGRSVFDQFFGSYHNEKLEIKSNPETIEILALPLANQPADFGGAVGQFDMSVDLDREKIGVNEAVNLTMKITGKGNLELITDPEVMFPSDFESYDPKTKQNISVTGAGTTGSKTFEYVVIPRYSGEFELKPITMSFFDPQKKSYERISTGPIKLQVIRADGTDDDNAVAYVAPKKEDVQVIGQDIRFIKTDAPSLKRAEEKFFKSPLFYGLTTLPFAGAGLAIFLIGFIRTKNADQQGVKKRRASSLAKTHLAKAKKLMAGEEATFYDEISQALFGYLSDKFSIPASELSRETIEDRLRSHNVPEELQTELRKALDECEMVRFAPGVVRGMQEMLDTSMNLIESMEDAV
ncbi:MAG: protein BatD [Flavobacteriales bacterium]|nr:protein BatD [Flavobacteriales bacterium]MBT4703988.1 protein BatD [Flavobacteriales bacterium]MBT4930316.1 protein BatD [Flavobacteriales bacterium]MBT5132539.1 protein BatD [Flavobacteriales bacterium]MBT6133206.1 protein BatD [Flavobacteriales bacterium]